MKKTLITLLKIVFPVAILVYLVRQVEPAQLELLRTQPKDWGLLSLAFLLSFTAVSLGFVRWWMLVRALGLPFRLIDAFRLGFLGFLLSFVSAGAVGGDLFKAVFIAREQPGRRAEAVATVFVDRIAGLYALLLVTTLAISGVEVTDPTLRVLCSMVTIAAVVGGLGLGALMLPTMTDGWLSERVSQLPFIGRAVAKVIAGVRMYKSRPGVMLVVAALSVSTHVMLACTIYLVAHALFSSAPPLSEHLVMVPLAMIANALPLAPGGLGQLEAALEHLYGAFPAASHAASGVLVALVFRLTTFAIAGVGAVFYIRGRREVEQIMDEARAAAPAAQTDDS